MLKVYWYPQVKAIVDSWSSYNISLEDFSHAVLKKGMSHFKANGGRAWIVDSHQATGSFSKEIQKFIETDVFPTFAKNGVKYFMTITSESALTRMTVSEYSAKVGPHGIKLLQGKSTEGAIEWLSKNG